MFLVHCWANCNNAVRVHSRFKVKSKRKPSSQFQQFVGNVCAQNYLQCTKNIEMELAVKLGLPETVKTLLDEDPDCLHKPLNSQGFLALMVAAASAAYLPE